MAYMAVKREGFSFNEQGECAIKQPKSDTMMCKLKFSNISSLRRNDRLDISDEKLS